METILVVNAGSSSLKFQVFGIEPPRGLTRLLKGQVDGIGARPRLRAAMIDGSTAVDRVFPPDEILDLPAAIHVTGAWLRETQDVDLVAIGHRVVHGGPVYDLPVLVTAEVAERLARYAPLAPLHQPNNLAPIRSILERRPDLPQVACFDTAFHRSHGALADHFALPAGGRQVDAQSAGAERAYADALPQDQPIIRSRSGRCWSTCPGGACAASKQIILDLDATDDPLHGKQEGRFFHGYYDCYCYLPLYVFCGHHLLGAKLRNAEIDARDGAVGDGAPGVGQVRRPWPRVRILIRADSGFAREKLMRWCEAKGVKFLFGMARNNRLFCAIAYD